MAEVNNEPLCPLFSLSQSGALVTTDTVGVVDTSNKVEGQTNT
jgi:hypothetical protein